MEQIHYFPDHILSLEEYDNFKVVYHKKPLQKGSSASIDGIVKFTEDYAPHLDGSAYVGSFFVFDDPVRSPKNSKI